MKEHYLILCNPESGKGHSSAVLAKFEAFLSERGKTFETFLRSYPQSLEAYTCMVIIGGDGTINHVINHFGEIQISIALLKGGTGNDYASLHLGKSNLEEQFELAIGQKIIDVDAGICNGKLFINGIGIGFDGWVVKSSLGKRFFTGIAAYYSTILSLLMFYKESKVSIVSHKENWSQALFMMSIAKGKTYGGGFRVAPEAHPANGVFDVISIHKISILNRFRYLPVIEKGRHMQLPFVKYIKATRIMVEAEHALQAHLDGEWMESKSFEVELLPEKYRIKSILSA